MTKASPSRLERKGKLAARRGLTPEELLEFRGIVQIANAKNWEAEQVKANTALVIDGQNLAKQFESLATLFTGCKDAWVAQKLVQCGYEAGTKCSINLSTGEIILTPHA